MTNRRGATFRWGLATSALVVLAVRAGGELAGRILDGAWRSAQIGGLWRPRATACLRPRWAIGGRDAFAARRLPAAGQRALRAVAKRGGRSTSPSADARADVWDDTFFSQAPRGLVLKVTGEPGTPAETGEVVRLATAAGADGWAPADDRSALHFLENAERLP